MFRKLWSSAVLAMAFGIGTAEGKEMDAKIQDRIAQAVQADYNWKADEVSVTEVESMRRPNCSFYTVAHKVRPVSFVLNYAALPGGEVVGFNDDESVTKILDACGSDAPADWWAEVVTRFHGELGAGHVLHTEQDDPLAVDRMKQAGQSFSRPALSSGGGVKTLSYYLMENEASVLDHVEATRREDGSVEVRLTKVF
jgi:hypothetical protein